MLPMYPAPPVTRIFNENPPGLLDFKATLEYTAEAGLFRGEEQSRTLSERKAEKYGTDRIESA
jgi:hypothetical protein